MVRSKKCKHVDVQAAPKSREQLPCFPLPASRSGAPSSGEFGQVWDTAELAREFIVTSIIRPLIVVRRKTDDVVGTLTVQEKPPKHQQTTHEPR